MADIKKIVKSKYSEIAGAKIKNCGCSCSPQKSVSQSIGYSKKDLAQVGEADLGLGCGNPVAFGKMKPGDTVVDLGSGAGIDCFLAAKKVGPAGKVIGVDFTVEMIVKAKTNALKMDFRNVDFVLGDIENLPLKDDSANVIISNCVINLAPDKTKVFEEAYRILKPGGRMFVSDIVLLEELSPEQRKDEKLIAGCVGGAILRDEYLEIVRKAGFKVTILAENKAISKEQYSGIPLESLLIEAVKQ
ncbi:MAG: arsenite methyltransferase [Patescibacteria group bacterium]|nr:arsenite methyltransferase [Patescibacteria group bacterium]